MYSRIKDFVNNSSSGQYLFTTSDFYLLQDWLIWMGINHKHEYNASNITDVEAESVFDTSIIIHRDATHGVLNRPVGYINNTSGSLQLTLADHVSNAGIHTLNEDDSNTLLEGSLVARGWSKPIRVRAVISTPVFEVMAYTAQGPIMMPFPMHNMSPQRAYLPNGRNNIDESTSYITAAPTFGKGVDLDPLIPAELNDGETCLPIRGLYGVDGVDNTGEIPIFHQEGYPYFNDAKNRTNASFWNEYHQFLYIIPPYLHSKVDIDSDFDKIVNSTIDQSNLAFFFHEPLFIDARDTKLLDRIKRSGVTADEITNFRDIIPLIDQDVDKVDLFNAESSNTCWLSKYRPIAVRDEKSTAGIGASLFFYDYQQEINQFVSQVNYGDRPTASLDDTYFDHPFKVVTVNFNTYNYDDSVPTGLSPSGAFYEKPFPACFYSTNFSNFLVESGGHNNDTKRPQEDFYFDLYPDGLRRHKKFLTNYYFSGSPDKDEIFDYFDRLNIPYGFTDGRRQVLILKDPDIPRTDRIFKRNPFSTFRCMAYIILDGYVSVPYEAFSSSLGSSSAFGGGTISDAESTSSVDTSWSTGGGNQGDPLPDQDGPSGDTPSDGSPGPSSGGGGGGGPFNDDSKDDLESGSGSDDLIINIIPTPPDSHTLGPFECFPDTDAAREWLRLHPELWTYHIKKCCLGASGCTSVANRDGAAIQAIIDCIQNLLGLFGGASYEEMVDILDGICNFVPGINEPG